MKPTFVKDFKIDIEPERAQFQKFLSVPDNDRVIFSGVFGTGKTTFLDTFFSKNIDYVSIHIFPTNYSVSQNEDIFDLIKHDILYEIINKYDPDFEKLDVSNIEALNFIDAKDVFKVFKSFVESIPQIGKYVTPIIKPIETLVNILKSKTKKLEVDERKEIEDFVHQIERTKGSIYENDLTTQLLTCLIQRIRKSDDAKESSAKPRKVILIVDDLDRIDPEHIFRILNIFAVHFDSRLLPNSANKFGIDKIILSCDIENIRKIFFHKYGEGVDFNGYIDKFYSHQIYYFDNRDLIARNVAKIMRTITFSTAHGDEIYFNNEEIFVNSVLTSMILSGTLNLRTLIKWYKTEWVLKEISVNLSHLRFTSANMPILKMVSFLKSIASSNDNLLELFSRTNFDSIQFNMIPESLLGQIIVFVDAANHSFELPQTTKAPRSPKYTVEPITITYEMSKQDSYPETFGCRVVGLHVKSGGTLDRSQTFLPMKQLLLDIATTLKKHEI